MYGKSGWEQARQREGPVPCKAGNWNVGAATARSSLTDSSTRRGNFPKWASDKEHMQLLMKPTEMSTDHVGARHTSTRLASPGFYGQPDGHHPQVFGRHGADDRVEKGLFTMPLVSLGEVLVIASPWMTPGEVDSSAEVSVVLGGQGRNWQCRGAHMAAAPSRVLASIRARLGCLAAHSVRLTPLSGDAQGAQLTRLMGRNIDYQDPRHRGHLLYLPRNGPWRRSVRT